MRNLLPPLWHRHRGFAMIALALVGYHLLLAADSLLPSSRHTAPVFEVLTSIASIQIWGTLHLIIGVLMIVGLYWDRHDMMLARCTFVASISAFLLIGLCFMWALVTNPLAPAFGIAGPLLGAICALGGVLEPRAQIVDRGRR